MQKAVRKAAKLAQIDKRVTCHTFRHSFATHIVALDEILISGLAALRDFVTLPIVAGAIAVLVLVRILFPSSGGILSILDELTASIGPLSVSGKLGHSKLFSQVEADAQTIQGDVSQPQADQVS